MKEDGQDGEVCTRKWFLAGDQRSAEPIKCGQHPRPILSTSLPCQSHETTSGSGRQREQWPLSGALTSVHLSRSVPSYLSAPTMDRYHITHHGLLRSAIVGVTAPAEGPA